MTLPIRTVALGPASRALHTAPSAAATTASGTLFTVRVVRAKSSANWHAARPIRVAGASAPRRAARHGTWIPRKAIDDIEEPRRFGTEPQR